MNAHFKCSINILYNKSHYELFTKLILVEIRYTPSNSRGGADQHPNIFFLLT